MTSQAAAIYTFLPWVRQGLGSTLPPSDASQPSPPAVATVAVSLAVDGEQVSMPIRLYGPGDVMGIDAREVVRTEPPNLTADFEPEYFPAVEFDRPDFPWLFTPHGAAGRRLPPWICLIVVPWRAGISLDVGPTRPLPVLRVDNAAAELPNLAEAWAWAHAQVAWAPDPASSQTLAEQLRVLLANEPRRTLSRLVCCRRLQPNTRYLACVVPTFEAGRKTGLGLELTPGDELALAPAWGQQAGAIELPVYYHWEFTTGVGGDFESLARALEQPALALAPEVGGQPMDVGSPGYGLDAGGPLTLEGGLCSLSFSPTPWPDAERAPFQDGLRALLERSTSDAAGPLLGPPVYGLWFVRPPALPPAAPGPPQGWLLQLNLDPRNRAAAGLGTLVVQQQQEQLMAAAWDQLAHLLRANQLLRQAQLARVVGSAVRSAHLELLPLGPLLQVTRPTHARLSGVLPSATTLAAAITASAIPDGTVAPTFRRLARAEGPLGRRLVADGIGPVPPVVERLNQRLIRVAPPRQRPDGTVLVDDVTAAAGTSYAGVSYEAATAAALQAAPGWEQTSATPAPGRVPGAVRTVYQDGDVHWANGGDAEIPRPPRFSDLSSADFQTMRETFRQASSAHQEYLIQALALADQDPSNAPLAVSAGTVLNRLDPAPGVVASVRQRLPLAAAQWQRQDPLDPISEAPEFPYPMYEPLRALSQEHILPGLASVPPNTVALLQTNTRFLEAFMVGLNHEMARELLWREFPTPRWATYFRQFWGDQAGRGDIPPIAGWTASSRLGDTAATWAPSPLVLLVRSDLLRRYPDATILAVWAVLRDGRRVPGSQEERPLFQGRLDPDIAFVGLGVMPLDARGNPSHPDPTRREGVFLVIQQHPTEPRFGLPAPDGVNADPATWAALTWSSLVPDDTALASLGYLGASWPRGGSLTRDGLTWGPDSDAAQLASITQRRPLRVAIHASALLPGEGL